MDHAARQATHSLIESLEKEPYRFDFFRAVRLLENERRDLPRVGCSYRLEEDAIRFAQNPSLAFAPSTLEAFVPGDATRPPRLFMNFLGLLGPNGPMPSFMNEFVRDRQRNSNDPTLARFLDVFNHRMISLFYRAWAAAQKNVDFDRPEEARFGTYIGSLIGIGMDVLRNRDAVPDRAKLYFSGRLANQAHNAEGLQAILSDFFQIPVTIQEFVGFWMTLPAENQCRLGESPETGSLGLTAIAGERKHEAQLKFRVRLGPMTLAAMQRMLPRGVAFQRLKDWVRNYVGDEFFWDVQCVLLASEVPSTSLGKAGMLGWTTWLKSEPTQRDSEDAIFNPECY